MKKYEELFVLIKSLSANEKRNFKLHASSYSSKSNYLKLFDAVDNQEKYDESAIKKKFATEKFINQLHVTKSYLRNLILKSLRSVDSNISGRMKVRNLLANIEILYSRTLYTHCIAEARKAEDLCYKYEFDGLLIDVLNWKRKLIQAKNPGNVMLMQEVVEAENTVINRMQNTMQHRQLMIEITKKGLDGSPDHHVDAELLKSEDNALSFQAKVQYYHSLYHLNIMSGDNNKAERAMSNLLTYMKANPDKLSLDPGIYISSVNNFISYYVFQNQLDQAYSLIRDAKEKYGQWNVDRKDLVFFRQILRTYNLELEIIRDKDPGNTESDVIQIMEGLLSNASEKIPQDYLSLFYFQLSSIFLQRRRYSNALKWINQFLNEGRNQGRQDLEVYMRIMNLMIHMELNNLFVLGYFIDSTKRYLVRIRNYENWMKILMKFFSKIRNVPESEKISHFRKLKEDLFADNTEPVLRPEVLDYIDLKTWIENNIRMNSA